MSEVKVNKLSPRLNCGTVTLGDSGDTFTIPAGVTITNNGTQTGFGRTGTVDWDTTAKTANFTAVSGTGYFVNTTSGAITATLPAGSAGAIVAFADYANTFNTNSLTIAPNGTDKIGGTNANATVSTKGASTTFVYVDSTQGWKQVNDATLNTVGENFITATGGTIVTCGDYKSHIFTGPGTFCVSALSTNPVNDVMDYLVVAGGGGVFRNFSAGGGAGGFRVSNNLGLPAPTMSPLSNPTGITATVTSYPITVGAGGSPGPACAAGGATDGSNSVFSTITSAGGGKSGSSANGPAGDIAGSPGGSGGGGDYNGGTSSGGTGNTPPTSPPQGNNGGNGGAPGPSSFGSGGGGGAGAAGASFPSVGDGGIGSFIDNTFIGPTAPSYGEAGPVGSTRYFSGGGGAFDSPNMPATTGGIGGGGEPGNAPGVVNTGGGGGGSPGTGAGGAGGSGIVIIRYKYQ